MSDALENHDNDADQDIEIHAYQTHPAPVLGSAIKNPMFMPVLVVSIFTPPQLLS